MAIILDADVLIRAEKEQFDLETWLRQRSGETVEIAAITAAGIWHGVERAEGERRRLRQQFVERILSRLSIVPSTVETAREHARVRAELETKGKMSGCDAIVAATVRLRGGEVATFNRQHFEHVVGLAIIEPA
jgi:predicted nucleic acid-binding protein